MNFYHFIFDVSGGTHNRYQRNSFLPDSQPELVGSSNNFSGDISIVSEEGSAKTILIDNTIKITTFSDKIFKDCRNFWKRMLAGSVLTCAVSVIVSAAVIGSGLFLCSISPSFLIVACVAMLLGLCMLGFAIFSGLRAGRAANELKLWDDPLEKCVKIRRDIPKEDFEKILAEQKYNTLVSLEEMKSLWEQSKSRYSPAQILSRADLKKFMTQGEVQELWEENKSKFTLKQLLENPELRKCASDEHLKHCWSIELNLLKQNADKLKNGSNKEREEFVRSLYEKKVLSIAEFPNFSSLLLGKECSDLDQDDKIQDNLLSDKEMSAIFKEILKLNSAFSYIQRKMLFKINTVSAPYGEMLKFNLACANIQFQMLFKKFNIPGETLSSLVDAYKKGVCHPFLNRWHESSFKTSLANLVAAYGGYQSTRLSIEKLMECGNSSQADAMENVYPDDFGSLFSCVTVILEKLTKNL